MTENIEEKEIIIGDFKPKREFLSFVSSVNGAKIRYIRDVAFIKGEQLSGVLDGLIFKFTICNEGTLKFEEVDTNQTDFDQRQRLLDDIDSMNVTGYAQKFVVGGLEFTDVNGGRCYLEVEHQKPIDKLSSLLDTIEEEKRESNTLSDKGLSILDSLFGDSNNDVVVDNSIDEDETIEEVVEEKIVVSTENTSISYMEEQFRKMNEDKVKELKSRIEKSEEESNRVRMDISQSEVKLKKLVEDIGVLETRLGSLEATNESIGYVFFVSEEQKAEDIGLTPENKDIADKIADIMGLKKDVLFNMLTQGFYKIRIADKNDIKSDDVKVDSEVLNKMKSLVSGDDSKDVKITMVKPGHFEYRGSLTWHQIVGKMIRNGFEQDPEFDKYCNSNSYDSKWGDDDSDSESNDNNEVNNESDDTLNLKSTSELYGEELKFVDTESTLVFIGTCNQYDNDQADIMITDDYSTLNVFIDGDKIKRTWGGFECDGFFSIMTLNEYKNWYDKAKDDYGLDDGSGIEGFVVTNLKGSIKVGATDEDGNYVRDINFGDYIQHQYEDCNDVFVNLPKGSEVIELNKDLSLPTSTLRDIKIDNVIN